MTTKQQNTANQILGAISRYNSDLILNTIELRNGHIIVDIFQKEERPFSTTHKVFCNVTLNTKGNVVKGQSNNVNPIEIIKILT